MSENYIVINGKKVELTKEQIEQLGIKVEKDNRWRAVNGGTYWFVDSRNIAFSTFDDYDVHDDFRYHSHNYFYNEEEAETYARVLETEMLLRRYTDEHNEKFKDDVKYYLYINDKSDIWECIKIQGVDTNSCFRHRQIYFSSKDIALNAIKEIGRDRIIEYLTYKW